MSTPTEPTTGTIYVGRFGTLCRYVPLFDASAADGWTITHRAYDRTVWLHLESDISIECRKTSDGWGLLLTDHQTDEEYPALPTNATRWNAYGAVRSFFEGEPLLPASPSSDSNWETRRGGVLTLERIQNERQE